MKIRRMNVFTMVVLFMACILCSGVGVASGESISGTVTAVDMPVPQTLTGYLVRVIGEHWESYGNSAILPGGSYFVGNLPANVKLIALIQSDPNSEYMGNAISFTLASGESRQGVDFSLVKAPDNQVQGRVRDPKGNGIANAEVHLFSQKAYFEKVIKSDPNGYYIIPHIKPESDYLAYVVSLLGTCNIEFCYSIDASQTPGDQAPAASVFNRLQATLLNIDVSTKISNIDMIVDPTQPRTIEGYVKAKDTGLPIVGYNVSTKSNDLPWQRVDRTDANGHYMVCGVPASQFLTICVQSPPNFSLSFLDQCINNISTIEGSLTGINFNLDKAPNNKIQGMIRDTSGKGIPNVPVSVFSDSAGFFKNLMTGPDGSYIATGLMPAYDYRVSVFFPMDMNGYNYFYSSSSASMIGKENAALLKIESATVLSNIDIIVGFQGGIIDGHVYKSDGSPLGGIRVNAWSEGLKKGGSALTDQTGYYKIWGLQTPISSADNYLIEIWSDQYAHQIYNGVTDPLNATLLPVGSTNIDFYLQTGFMLSGKVTDAANVPFPNAEVTAWSSLNKFVRSEKSDANGQYKILNIPPGNDYIISVMAQGYPKQWYDRKTDEQTANKVDLSSKNVMIDFALNKGPIIQGVVYIGDSAHPGPAGIRVEAASLTTKTVRDTITDVSGSYQIMGLDSNVNDYILSVHVPNYPPLFYADNQDTNLFNDIAFRFEDAKGVAPSQIQRNFILPNTVNIKGKLTFNGIPVAKIRVEAHVSDAVTSMTGIKVDYGWRDTFTADTITDGFNYSITGIIPGPLNPLTHQPIPIPYNVSIHPPVELFEFAVQSRDVQVTGQDVLNVDFELSKKESRSISGTITGITMGKTVLINAWSESIRSGNGIMVIGTGSGISYTITSLVPAADYVVSLSSKDSPLIKYNNKAGSMPPDFVDISNTNANGIDFSCPDASNLASISGSVTFPADGEVAWVEAVSPSTGIRLGTEVKSMNKNLIISYQINGLTKTNDYIVSVRSPKYQVQYYNGKSAELDASPVDISSQSASGINFVLAEGATISGKVLNADGSALSDRDVHAWSESTRTGGHAITSQDGSYTIRGLTSASDYIVETNDQKTNLGSYFYNQSGTVRDPSAATQVSTQSGNAVNIVITISTGLSISGTVKTVSGLTISGIWVSAWSDKQMAGNGVFSSDTGTYEIKGLPTGYYQVSVEPMWSSSYLSQKKNDISAGTSNVDFSLTEKTGNYNITGYVKDSSNKPVPNIVVELWSSSSSGILIKCGWGKTDNTGYYAISGMAAGNYNIIAKPPLTSSYAEVRFDNISISGNTSKDISLDSARGIQGKVTATDGTSIKGAAVHVYSQTKKFWRDTITDNDGNYKIVNAPSASDYVITVMKDGYANEEKQVQIPDTGTCVTDFTLNSSGSIYGEVDDPTGKPMSNVLVEVYSENRKGMLNYSSSARTDDKGIYRVKGLRTQDALANTLNDYIVVIEAFTAASVRYMRSIKTGNSPGDKVDFILVKALSGTELSGSVGNPTLLGGDYVAADIFKKSDTTVRFDQHVIVNSDGSFKFEGLDTSAQYYLGFGVYTGANLIPDRYQWSSDCTLCVYDKGVSDSTDHSPPVNAKLYSPGNTNVSFKFDNSSVTSVRSIVSVPGPVVNLRSFPSISTNISSNSSGISERSSAQNMSRTPSETVTNSPTVAVTWEPSSSTSDEKYYFFFDQNSELKITKRNAPPPSVTSRAAISSDLSGDYATYYFHVAVEDSRGYIGDTSTLSFSVDTLPPKNTSVRASNIENISTTGVITLELGATGADEIYVSSTNFGEGGEWENFSTSKQWTLSQSGTSAIYVQFRDLAKNTVNATVTVNNTVTVDPLSISNAISALQILTGITTATAADATNDAKISIEDVIYILQSVSGLR